VPLTLEDDDQVPHLHFRDAHDYEVVALNDITNGFVFERPATITSLQADTVTCSFAGGCDYTIFAEGLTSSLMHSEDSSIEVCGNTCELNEGSSDEGQATCTL
jgi:hypothetical protein